MTNAFRLWLEPLQEVAKQPLVDSFRYRLDADQEVDNWDLDGSDADDLRVFFRCIFEASYAVVGAGFPPQVYIGLKGVDLKRSVNETYHEVGHAFGLHDTYIVDPARDKSSGGLAKTKGKQPSSMMSGYVITGADKLGTDDINGIIWLYKAAYEGLAANDCFFPDYVYEVETRGCRPKYPLIFEIKHGQLVERFIGGQWVEVRLAAKMLEDDPNLDINARDASGRTALHYAVMYEQRPVVEKLLARADLNPYLSDKEGKTAAELAKETGQDDIAERILAHPRALSVSPKGKQPLTLIWGELKRAPR